MNGLATKSKIHETAFVHPTAEVVGDVTVEENCIIAPHCSVRADEGSPFHISKGTNLQDGVVFHGLGEKTRKIGNKEYSIFIGPHCSIAHGALIHGPTVISKKSFVGFKVIIHNSFIGERCFIDHGAIVCDVALPNRTYVGKGMIVDSQAVANNLPRIVAKHLEFNKDVVDFNKDVIAHYKDYYAQEQDKYTTSP